MRLRLGTRKSLLAMWQAEHIADLLQKKGVEVEIVPFETKGDKILDRSLSKIGSKGVFTEELEQSLVDGTIDLAVHSAKDVQSDLDEGLEIIAFTTREKTNDVLVSEKQVSLKDTITVGTSSTRRIALLKHFYPHVKTVNVRGNLQTRLRKMEEGLCDALLLAYAGVHRMGYDEKIVEELNTTEFVPPVGQGTIAIEVCVHTLAKEAQQVIKDSCNDTETEYRLKTERAFLKKMEGGCSIPSFGHAIVEEDQVLFTAGLVSLNGQEMVKTKMQGATSEAEILGEQMANYILQNGGKEILQEIKKSI